jgi:Rrf2 family transcriptional regulator, iron-sulfur cluster assembly transcription factor
MGINGSSMRKWRNPAKSIRRRKGTKPKPIGPIQWLGSLNIVCLPRIHRGKRMPLLPNKTVLAIGAVVDIAMHSGKEPVTASDLAHRFQLPRRFLEPALQALVRAGILKGERGRLGGYRLAKAQSAISVFDISEAVKTVEAEKPNDKFPRLLALTQPEQHFASTLKRITVGDLVQAASARSRCNS